jgi:hypothetical protein
MLMKNFEFNDFFIKKGNEALIIMDLIIVCCERQGESEEIIRPALFVANLLPSSDQLVHRLPYRI